MAKRGSNSELFAHENDALTARPQCYSDSNHSNVQLLNQLICITLLKIIRYKNIHYK